MRLTETEKQQLLAATRVSASDLEREGHNPDGNQDGILSFAEYMEQVQQFAPILSRTKPIAFEGNNWKL